MKKVFLLFTFCTPIYLYADIIKKAKKGGTQAGQSVTEKTQKTTATVRRKAKEKVAQGFEKISEATSLIAKDFENIMAGHPTPSYCSQAPNQAYGPTTANHLVRLRDYEQMIPTIERYSPVLYLCKESYLPIATEDYFTNPGTRVLKSGQVIIPSGNVTFAALFEQYKKLGKVKDKTLSIDIAECTKFGSNPSFFTDQGILITPAYVMWFTDKDKIYINYVFLYGFNGPYTMKGPGGVPLLKGDLAQFQNAHEFDLEHITLELNKNKQLERIFFGAHAAAEGVWLPAQHKDIQYEGTHPVVYVAHSGHGTYPRLGTHVRIYGFANDLTCQWKKWIPQLVLLYPENDERFNPDTMGWVYFPGSMGPRGIDSLMNKPWFYNAEAERRSGMPHGNVQLCPNPSDNPLSKLKYKYCIEKKRSAAKPPSH